MSATSGFQDADFMAAALQYGRRGLGLTSPNPAVGALVVKDGIIVGRGFTQAGGRPHAEPVALAQAGATAQGATLYVTLEPCSHIGKTPPCVDAIIAAGIVRVVSAMEDPNPLVAGQGHAKLRAAGLEVMVGIGEGEARAAHMGHILRVTQGRPMVTLKIAQTADGYAAGGDYDPRLMITGQAANSVVQVWRSQNDAIMIGSGTARDDDPSLTVRLAGVRCKPLRVVLDRAAALNVRSRLVSTASEIPTLAFVGEDADKVRISSLKDAGVDVEILPLAGAHLDLRAALKALSRRGITRVFSEGGPRVGSALIVQGLADEVLLLSAPKPFGRAGVPALSTEARSALSDGGLYSAIAETRIGIDKLQKFERC